MARGGESGFQQAVEELAGHCRWLVYHTYDSRRSAAGFPDLVLVRGHRLIFAELKASRGRVSPDQQRWLTALRTVGVARGIEVHLWYPADWDAIVAVLR